MTHQIATRRAVLSRAATSRYDRNTHSNTHDTLTMKEKTYRTALGEIRFRTLPMGHLRPATRSRLRGSPLSNEINYDASSNESTAPSQPETAQGRSQDTNNHVEGEVSRPTNANEEHVDVESGETGSGDMGSDKENV